jgi:hypothetical protein
MGSPVQESLDRAWRGTCRVLFGQEAGSLSDCAEWLAEYGETLRVEKSALSGKTVTFSVDDYARGAAYAAFDEVDFGRKFEPLSINEIKDIDSIVEAVQGRASYTGNVILGNSNYVEDSSSVLESHFVLDSTVISDSKYVAYSRYVKGGEYCFGIFGSTEVEYVVKCMGSELKRCFECHMVEVLSDCYYCAKAQNSRDCMFCFGTYNGACQIGNTALPKDKYMPLKAKLLAEIAEKIRKEKKIFSLLTLIEACSGRKPDSRLKLQKVPEPHFDITPVEKGFRQTTQLLLGRELAGIDSYKEYLYRHVPRNFNVKSALTGNKVVVGGYRAHLLKKWNLGKRMATEDEMIDIGKFSLEPKDVEKISLDQGLLVELLHPVAYTNLDKIAGNVKNSKNAAVAIDCTDCYEGSAFIWSKRCSHCFWVESSENMFGCDAMWGCSFCLKTYYSRKMTRAFECDNCQACADIYFSHNCENVRDSMFCFNVKNLNNAIGNAVLPSEQYRKAKGALVAQLADELERTKDLKWDIFNIGSSKRI